MTANDNIPIRERFTEQYAHTFRLPNGNEVIFTKVPTHPTLEQARECPSNQIIQQMLGEGVEVIEPTKVLVLKEDPTFFVAVGAQSEVPGPLGYLVLVGGPRLEEISKVQKEKGMAPASMEDPAQLQAVYDEYLEEERQANMQAAQQSSGPVGHA